MSNRCNVSSLSQCHFGGIKSPICFSSVLQFDGLLFGLFLNAFELLQVHLQEHAKLTCHPAADGVSSLTYQRHWLPTGAWH